MDSLQTGGLHLALQCIEKVRGLDPERQPRLIHSLQALVSPGATEIVTGEGWEDVFRGKVEKVFNADLMKPLPEGATEGDAREVISRLQTALNMAATLRRFVSDPGERASLRQVVSAGDPQKLKELLAADPKHFLEAVCTGASSFNASDIFWKVGQPPLFKISNRIVALDCPAMTQEDMHRIFVETVMSPQQKEHFEGHLSLDKGLQLEGVEGVRFRANVFHQLGNIGCVMRLIPKEIPTVESLGLPLQIKKLINHQQGLVIVTGATGSGKSTTLAALIGLINESQESHIVTIEDPIEFVHDDKLSVIEQRETRVDTPSFDDGIKDVLRQAPNVILIGELRDANTMTAALHAAETGHLVFTTLHTNSAAETLARITGFYETDAERAQICSSLSRNVLGILSQKLIPRSDGNGRVCAMEVMIASPTVQQHLEEGRIGDIEKLIEDGSYFGMQSMQQALLKHVTDGSITKESAINYATTVSSMKQALRQMGART